MLNFCLRMGLLDQLGNRFKHRTRCILLQLKQNSLRRCHQDAFLLRANQTDFHIMRRAGANAVLHNDNLLAHVNQIHCRLQHADVQLCAAQQHGITSSCFHSGAQTDIIHAAECGLWQIGHGAQYFLDFRHCRAQSLRILLRGNHRNVQCF